jgi:hypothetical protein
VVALAEWTGIDMPEADRYFFAPVVLGDGRPYERTFHYDGELRLLAPASTAG